MARFKVFEVNGNRHIGYTVADVEKFFSNTVSNYLKDGYRISFQDFGKQTDEIYHTDLTNDGKTIIRVVIISDFVSNFEERYGVLTWNLMVLKFENAYNEDTLWNSDGKILTHLRFYNIGKFNYDESEMFFTFSKNAVIDVKKLREKRYQIKLEKCKNTNLSVSKNLALKLLKKRMSFGKLKENDITSVLRRPLKNEYIICFNLNGIKSSQIISLAN